MAVSEASFRGLLAELQRAATDVLEAQDAREHLTDDALMDAQRTLAEVKKHVDASAALLVGETVRRSSRDEGLGGIARKNGYRTPVALVQAVTGVSAREATTLVRVGGMVNDSAVADSAVAGASAGLDGAGAVEGEWWLAPVGAAVSAGALSVASAEAIRAGLGSPAPGVSAAVLADAAKRLVETLVAEAAVATGGSVVNSDHVLRRARDARDELDAEGVAERERQRRALRSFRRWRKPDGMTRYTWELDPEGAALIDDIYDKITSPRRGGPRFVSETDRARAEAIERDPRTTEQLASDGMLQLLQLAIDTGPTDVVGVAQPAVRVLVSARDLASPTGRGWIEGQADPVSITTVQRHICRGGLETIIFDGQLQPANLGRTQRTFNRTQRRLLAARDGGCRWPGCERPPEWTEAHHIHWWDRDQGPTNIDNGILLCRHHHLLLHDNHWQIRTGAPPPGPRPETQYWLVPPPDIDPAQKPRPMPSKSRALRDALRPPGTEATPQNSPIPA